MADPSPEGDEAIIHERLRTTILAGRLPPGTRLPEAELAHAFAVGRSQVRSVLQRLAWDGLVELARNRGAAIKTPGVREAREVFEARRVIERVTTEIAARTILTHHLAALRRQVAAQERALLEGDRQRAVLEAREFHRRLSGLAHNQALTAALEPLILRSALIVAVYGTPRATLRAAAHHHEILDLIERGDSLAASRAMERCLFAVERELDLTKPPTGDVDLGRIVRTVG